MRDQTKQGKMEMVKRYDLMQQGDYDQREGVMTEVNNGDWVSFDDYERLADEIERLRTIITGAKVALKDAISDLDEA